MRIEAKRIHTILASLDKSIGKVSYWQQGNDVYRLNEYEPIQFDIYGIPLGARWECTRKHFDSFRYLFDYAN